MAACKVPPRMGIRDESMQPRGGPIHNGPILKGGWKACTLGGHGITTNLLGNA